MAIYEKGRDWATVVYPESVVSNWLEILEETHLQIAISPLHDKDLNPDNTEKKAHYHLLIRYEGPTTKQSVKRLCDSIGAVNPIKIDSARGMYRYHIHQDNPEKYQYDDRDRVLLGGFDVSRLESLTETEFDKFENMIIEMIEEYNIIEYYQLISILKEKQLYLALMVAKKRTIMLNAFIKSRKGYLSKSIDNEK